jgi:hypothetical protein
MACHDGACDDGEVDHTRSSGGEGTNGPRGISGVVMGDGGINGSVGDGVREHDGYQQSRRVRADIEAGCASALEESWTRARPWFLEEDLERIMGMAFMGTNGEAEVGTLRGSARRRLSHNARGSETMGVR